MTEGRDSTLLILLVGSNPLPNYLSACALRPSRLALVYTEQTKDGKQRLQMKLKEVLGKDLNYNDALVEDATDATAVGEQLTHCCQAWIWMVRQPKSG